MSTLPKHTIRFALVALCMFWGSYAFAFGSHVLDDTEILPEELQGALASEMPSIYYEGHVLLFQWQVHEAETRFVERAEKEANDNPEAAYFLAHYWFMRSEYEKARGYMDLAGGKAPGVSAKFEPFLEAGLAYAADYQRVTKEHFEFRFPPGIDSVLVPYADATLEAAYNALGDDLGLKPKERIIVEFVPSAEALSALTGLPVEAIKTTGIIAICKFNRLIVTTPRVTVMGYQWRDTVSHEYVHLVITQKSLNHVPIWLHEGIARFQETRWRLQPDPPLDIHAETLLAKALRTKHFITLQQMHPSIAYLPSQEDGALAYAEAATIIKYLYRKKGGYKNIRRLLSTLAENDDMDRALKTVYGFDLNGLQTAWMRFLPRLGLRERAVTSGLDVAYKNDSAAAPKNEENMSPDEVDKWLEGKKAAKYFKVGKLLKDRGRHKAALVEFEKARQLEGSKNPMLQNIIADGLLREKRYEDVLKALTPLLDLYSGPAMTYYNLGRAHMELGQVDKAIEHFMNTISINPFDPRSHLFLATIYRQQKKGELALQEQNIYNKLSEYLTR